MLVGLLWLGFGCLGVYQFVARQVYVMYHWKAILFRLGCKIVTPFWCLSKTKLLRTELPVCSMSCFNPHVLHAGTCVLHAGTCVLHAGTCVLCCLCDLCEFVGMCVCRTQPGFYVTVT